MSLLNRIESSKFSLQGNGFDPHPGNPDFGYLAKGQSVLVSDRGFSNLHNQYSVYSLDNKENETTMRVVDYNKTQYTPYVPKETSLDPLDNRAPKNREATNYSNQPGQKYSYSDQGKGPSEGRY